MVGWLVGWLVPNYQPKSKNTFFFHDSDKGQSGVWCMVYGVWCMVYGVWCMAMEFQLYKYTQWSWCWCLGRRAAIDSFHSFFPVEKNTIWYLIQKQNGVLSCLCHIWYLKQRSNLFFIIILLLQWLISLGGGWIEWMNPIIDFEWINTTLAETWTYAALPGTA